MTDDLNRKSVRQFQCRDYLWEIFEQMSQELDCSVDYLVNEAMRHYARGQGKIRGSGHAPSARPASAPNLAVGPSTPPVVPSMGNGQPPAMRPPPMPGGPVSGGMNARPAYPGAPVGPGTPPSRVPPGPVPQMPPMPSARPPQMPAIAPAAGTMLYAVFEGQRYPINKDEFFIGRSNKSCDLIVKDPNVSRQHARIVRHQGQFWMVDMGSTNGIEFQGGRVDRRPIHEGDVFRICDHEIAFTFR